MLSPSINYAKDLIAQAFNEVLRLDSYAMATGNTVIGQLPKDPTWLPPIRNRVQMLAKAGASWVSDKPDIWAPVLLQFINYSSSFSALAEAQATQTLTREKWIDLLSALLLTQLKKCVSETGAAATGVQTHYSDLKNIIPLITESINEGWQALADEEKQMLKIAVELTNLQNTVNTLAGNVTSGEISAGKSIITTTVTMLYNVATSVEVSFSFLSMAAAVFTVGKMYYDIISNTQSVADALEKIATLQLEASQEAQAAAGTKLVLQLAYNLELTLLAIKDVVPLITTMWTNQQQAVEAVIDALKAGADPNTLFELYTIPTANANWQAIANFAQAIPGIKSVVGKPVVIDPQHPLTLAKQN
jgi:hypothetical protein